MPAVMAIRMKNLPDVSPRSHVSYKMKIAKLPIEKAAEPKANPHPISVYRRLKFRTFCVTSL